jgi:hypothetical protein
MTLKVTILIFAASIVHYSEYGKYRSGIIVSVKLLTAGWMSTEFGCGHEQKMFLPQATLFFVLGSTEPPTQ